ncbi:CDGSH iron-sulfur domain-containing protein [Botrimarina hoheduenensis]|uniref:Iron-binding zinc finger CDGSH type n=1 Tax=Botrimarina hoheduenensis TaxID=2528000 RepID=A0A5C5W8C5_9BACT|nr:CDGSH iron-sulfur domain-containing protein [Botrimarina hoheduenensis]TWT46707.1 Iron-binding zinc finger CDGSH type [Botrimarina hoheduenensis]
MSDVKINVRKNGPLLIEGKFTLVDAEGNAFPLDPAKPAYALCRCGQSGNNPFCDGTHKSCGFESEVIAPAE